MGIRLHCACWRAVVTGVLLLAWALLWPARQASAQAAPASQEPSSTVSTEAGTQVIGGLPARPDEFPEAVMIELRRGAELHVCSGVLVAPALVLSAAHCVQQGLVPVRVIAAIDYRRAPSLGTNPDWVQAPGAQAARIVRSEAMPAGSSSGATGVKGRDLMLHWLAAPLRAPTRALAVSSLMDLEKVQRVRVVGYGESDSKTWGTRLFGDMRLASARCKTSAAPLPALKHGLCVGDAEMVAITPDQSVDTCLGDSGGPVYVQVGQSEFRLIAITSRGSGFLEKCGAGTIGTLLDGPRLAWILSMSSDVRVLSGRLVEYVPPAMSCEEMQKRAKPGQGIVC